MSEITVTPRGVKAPIFLPCLNNRCGKRWQLRFMDMNGQILDEPFYLCERKGCWYSENPTLPVDVGGRHDMIVPDDQKRQRYRSNESIAPDEGMTAL